ncbi:MAG: hypothetical protein A2Z83_02905 [Omnitrophica bacterium GWA2_52_8]|nr:MAG: hypothetical protein A2Z83_02905 [Omnitrophica bacterium GWA2_52_8]
MKFRFILLFFLLLLSFPAYAKKEDEGSRATLHAPTDVQPYPHQIFESQTQKGTTIHGQVYRPRENLVVLEMMPEWKKSHKPKPTKSARKQPGEAQEAPVIKSVRLKTESGKVYETEIRRVPSWFMPTARQNYQTPAGQTAAPVSRAGEEKAP